MRSLRRFTVTLLLSGIALCGSYAQQPTPPSDTTVAAQPAKKKQNSKGKILTSDERLAVLASALDSKVPRLPEYDCSHLVHAIYERAGFPYAYADSDALYDGVEGFQRVSKPEPGDLVVWHGHAGIVIRPSRHVFFSFLHAGPGISDYSSHYWKGRGEPRFYRYLKNHSCTGCTLARGRAE